MCNEEVCNLYSSVNITRLIKSCKYRRMGHIVDILKCIQNFNQKIVVEEITWENLGVKNVKSLCLTN
jgi:hypothetical protein